METTNHAHECAEEIATAIQLVENYWPQWGTYNEEAVKEAFHITGRDEFHGAHYAVVEMRRRRLAYGYVVTTWGVSSVLDILRAALAEARNDSRRFLGLDVPAHCSCGIMGESAGPAEHGSACEMRA